MRVLAAVVGFALVTGVFLGMVDTLISTRLRTSTRRRFSSWLPSVMWPLFRTLAGRARATTVALGGRDDRSEARREAILSVYPPVVLLLLISFWVGFQVLGWGLVWWGSGLIDGVTELGESLYYSGVVYFTVGFGEIVPVAGLARLLTLVEAFSGVMFIALTVGYLPSLYSAFSEREHELLLIDDGSEDRITPLGLMVELLDDSDDFRLLDPVLSAWERWVALVLETHTSHPVLAYFRSQHAGQSWVTAMGLMADVALSVVVLEGRRSGPAWRLYRRIVRTLDVVAASLRLQHEPVDRITREQFQVALDDWAALGWELPDDAEVTWVQFRELRHAYSGQLEALIDHLDAPRGFWGHNIGIRGTGPGADNPVGRDAGWDTTGPDDGGGS